MIGFWLPAWQPRAKVKEVVSPKFYLFDPGVVQALAGRLREPPGLVCKLETCFHIVNAPAARARLCP